VGTVRNYLTVRFNFFGTQFCYCALLFRRMLRTDVLEQRLNDTLYMILYGTVLYTLIRQFFEIMASPH
jgi:hypothetical protein